MPFIFAEWATAHALNLMGPMGLCFPYFYGKMGIAHALYLMDQIHFFSASPWTFSTPAATFSPPSTWTASWPDAVQAMKPPASEAGRASRVPTGYQHHQRVRPHWWLPAAANSAWTALVVAPKMALQRAWMAPENWRCNGAGCSPNKCHFNAPEWRLKIGSGMTLQWCWLQPQKWHFNAPEWCLKIGVGMALQWRWLQPQKMALQRAWKLALVWRCNGAGCSPKNGSWTALGMGPEAHLKWHLKRSHWCAWKWRLNSAAGAPENGIFWTPVMAFYKWMMPTIYGSPAAIV